MEELNGYIEKVLSENPVKIILSNPLDKTGKYRKINITKKASGFQVETLTETQAFHSVISGDEVLDFLLEFMKNIFTQLNAFTPEIEYSVKLTKKGRVLFSKRKLKKSPVVWQEHNRQKNYILKEGMQIEPLVDMGVFTKEGKVVQSMYDKFRQINRFIELVDDALTNGTFSELTVIDFGCGKSYLTFLLYYYLTVIKNIKTKIIGLDLKEEVIKSCNDVAKKYGYDGVSFQIGDISSFKADFAVDMVITLHACDTATDFALYNAVSWGAKMIFSVPCCQHELNAQLKSDTFSIMTRYGIIKERISAALTDAIRANLLTCCGYKTQLLEFIDFEHTPKNIMIRAVKTNIPISVKNAAIKEVINLTSEFNLQPTLLKLLKEGKLLN